MRFDCTGAGGVGLVAASLTQRLPLSFRRYVRVNIAASATAGDSTGKKVTLALWRIDPIRGASLRLIAILRDPSPSTPPL